MIQPQELRKGNKIIANGLHGGRIMTVDRLADKGTLSEENRPVMFEEHEVGEFLKDCDGVPLTPEILEAAGFGEGRDDYSGQTPVWSNGISLYQHEDNLFSLYRYNDHKTYAEYVHELQNLFFALTGTELTINLEKVKV